MCVLSTYEIERHVAAHARWIDARVPDTLPVDFSDLRADKHREAQSMGTGG